jgi:hypothetical protein
VWKTRPVYGDAAVKRFGGLNKSRRMTQPSIISSPGSSPIRKKLTGPLRKDANGSLFARTMLNAGEPEEASAG